MTKDNILYSIIGVLLGALMGYVFASSVNQNGYLSRAQSPRGAAAAAAGQAAGPGAESSQGAEAAMPSNAVKEQGVDASADQALIEQAEKEPDNFDVQMSAAAIQYRNRRFPEAVQLLMRANQLRPDSLDAIIALGNANFDANNFEIAEKWYTAALVKNPKDINVRTDLGLTFLFRAQPDVDRAIQEFRRSLEIDPSHEQTLQNMTVALIKKGSFAEAETTLIKLREVNPGNQSLTKLGTDLEAARRSSKQPASKGK
jgi:tetratricopeptide (TPR) repeat protein